MASKKTRKTNLKIVKASKKVVQPGEKKAKAEKKLNPCLCGCGAEVKGRFGQGHDARLHSIVLKVAAGKEPSSKLPKAPAAIDYIKGAKWFTKDIASKLGL